MYKYFELRYLFEAIIVLGDYYDSAVQKQDNQHEHTFSNYVRIRDVVEDLPEAMNDREKWRERAGISVLPTRHDDDYDWIGIITWNH